MADCLMAGLGGFTTCSTLSLEPARLLKAGAWLTALIYVCSSALPGVLAVLSARYILG